MVLSKDFLKLIQKFLIIADRYFYNGKEINVINRLPEILKKIKSIKHVILINYPGQKMLKVRKFTNVKIFKYNDIKKLNSRNIYLKNLILIKN